MKPLNAHINKGLQTLPAGLASVVSSYWADFIAALSAYREEDSAEPHLVGLDDVSATQLCRVWACSEFVARSCIRYPALLLDLLSSSDLKRVYAQGEMRQHVQQALATVTSEAQLGEQLRHCRRREMVRIAWRDLSGQAVLEETMGDVSRLADACIDEALIVLQAWHNDDFGIPVGERSGKPQSLVVLGMGKLGAFELNYSSDIDLIFAFPESGETRDGRRSIANEQYFIGLGQRLIKALDSNTAQGFVFRVDMRLRPHGESGPLAINFDAMEAYYQRHGRDWERYAMIKARPVAGDLVSGQQLLDSLRPFVYRRYLDYGTFEALRDMKDMIDREVQRKGLQTNIKLGPGGIREIEFIGQLFQLIRGGREPVLRQRGIQPILRALVAAGHLPEFVGTELLQDYVQLRRIENRLQAWADEQVHSLPPGRPENEPAWQRLALSLDIADTTALRQQIKQLRSRVQGHFEHIFEAPQAEAAELEDTSRPTGVDWQAIWLGDESTPIAGFADTDEVRRRLRMLREGHACRALSAQGRDRLDRLMPLLLGAVVENTGPDQTLQRVLHLLESIMRRTSYLALLIENPMALSQLVQLCAASPWISEQLALHPLLLDELLDPRSLYAPPGRDKLEKRLKALLDATDDHDLEQQMEVLRHFKQTQVLRVAAADLVGAIPLMIVSDHLTVIAEVTLAQVLNIAARDVVPEADRSAALAGFAIIAYGKMGGIELGYGSDLDLVFLHDGNSELIMRYTRLGQRIVHILTARTPAGILYEVDMRLRPSGASGLLVSSITAFADYQRDEAWTWEHQAIIRARCVAGAPSIADRFAAVRTAILARPRDAAQLRQEVSEMRERMRKELARGDQDQFDIKQGLGGIADIEFLVQFAVLCWAGEHPVLLRWTDNIRQLEALAEAGLLSNMESRLLIDAYQAYRACNHRQALQQQPGLVPVDEFSEYRAAVVDIWSRLLGQVSA
jgi:glutamate-ammonia-ligase adenylyltransferase